MENYFDEIFGEVMNALGEKNSFLKTDNENLKIQVMYHNPDLIPINLSEKGDWIDLRSAEEYHGIRLISPMDTLVRDKTWLSAMFDYSFSFEYFKKKGMKWPLSILVGNQFVGYLDCKMDWKTQQFIIKEKNVFNSSLCGYKDIDYTIEELATFHNAKEIVDKS